MKEIVKEKEIESSLTATTSGLKSLSVEELIKIYRNSNNPDILNLIIKKTEKLAYKIAGDFKSSHQYEQKDIIQVALMGLLIAVNRFDPESDNKFSTFAYHYIKGEILHFIRDSGLVKSPRWIWKINKMFNEYVNNFEIENNRYPTIEEISEGINIPIEGIYEFLEAREAVYYSPEGIDGDNIIKGKNKSDGDVVYNRSHIKSKEYKSFELVIEDKIILWDAIDKLSGLNKKILILSYFSGLSQKEIGEKVGISQKSVSRKLKECIDILKEHLT